MWDKQQTTYLMSAWLIWIVGQKIFTALLADGAAISKQMATGVFPRLVAPISDGLDSVRLRFITECFGHHLAENDESVDTTSTSMLHTFRSIEVRSLHFRIFFI